MTDTSNLLFSVVIPARDEEKELPRCLNSLEKSWAVFQSKAVLPSASYEVIVVINRCTDQTEQIARSRGCRVVCENAKNLAAIRNVGVRASNCEFVVTVDADSRVSINMFETLYKRLNDPGVVGGGVLILPDRWSLGIFLTGLMLVPIALWYRISAGLFFFRRSAFESVGGFNEMLPSVEDIAFAKALRAFGQTNNQRFVNVLSAHIVTSCRKFDRFGDWYFLRHPLMTLRLLRGVDAVAADTVWYDFPR
jgi:glycosyltransferase involved in cell wall biosynthesis